MASITDCVVEGLKYPFNDIKKLLACGVLFALTGALSAFISIKSLDIFRVLMQIIENNNSTVPQIPYSQLPQGDIYIIIALHIISFIVCLFILGYQYDVVKFSIDKKSDLPRFNDIPGMFVKGVKYFIVILIYSILPVILFAGGVMLAGNSSIFSTVILIAGLLFIIAYFLMIMGLNNMIAYDNLKKAFDLKEITANITNLGWGKYIGIIIFTMIVMMIISAAVNFMLSFIIVVFVALINNQAVTISFIISIIEGLFIYSYITVSLNRVCGSIYRESVK